MFSSLFLCLQGLGSSIDLRVNVSLCSSVRPFITYCYVSANWKKGVFKEIILGLQAKSKDGKATKCISLESTINNVWLYSVFNCLVLQVFKMVDYYSG